MTKTNPIGSSTANLSVNVPKEMWEKLHVLAQKSNMKLGAYVRIVLNDACKRDTTFNMVVSQNTVETFMENEDIPTKTPTKVEQAVKQLAASVLPKRLR